MTRAAAVPRTVPEPGHVSPIWTFLRLLGGWAVVALLAYFMWMPGDWPLRLLAWVGLTILADEFGGWFGYIGAALGGLAFFAPAAPPAQWAIIVPLVGGALLALLLVKHSGGPFVLPFAAAIFALPLLAVGRFGTRIDPELTLPANATFQRTALTAMLAAVAFSFVRQVVGVLIRHRAHQRVLRASLPATPVSLDLSDPALKAGTVPDAPSPRRTS